MISVIKTESQFLSCMKKLNYRLPFLLGLILINQNALSQNDIIFTQFWNQKNYFNPATVGIEYKIQANVMARQQWNGVNGAPDSQLANFSLKLKKYGGFGVNYLHDAIGYNQTNRIKINYSYPIKFKNESVLAFGVAAGMSFLKTEGEWVPPTTASDPILPKDFRSSHFMADLGLVYSKNKFNIGFSVNNLTIQRSSNMFSFAPLYYLFTDYRIALFKDFQLKPQILIRTDLVEISADLNMNLLYHTKYWIGISYRTSDAICFLAGWNIKEKFRISYSYDWTINKLSTISKGSHEVHLGFYLK